MTESIRLLIDGNLAAVESRDLDAALRYFAEDAVLIDQYYSDPRVTGMSAIVGGFRWLFSGMERMGFETMHAFESADGNSAAVEVMSHHVLQGGRQLEFSQCSLWICGMGKSPGGKPTNPMDRAGLVA